MRVTDSMFADLARAGVSKARERVSEAQRAASSGVRVNKPSVDPLAASTARRRAEEQARVEAMLQTANAGVFGLQVIDHSLNQVGTILERARELALSGANGTLAASDRQAIAAEVGQLRAAAIAAGNTNIDNRYIFGGYTDDTAPFDAAGNFVGDNNVRDIEVAPRTRVEAGVATGNIFAPAGGSDIIGVLGDLQAALLANDQTAVRNTIDPLAAATDQIANGRADVGAKLSTLEMAQNVSTRLRDSAIEEQTALVGADLYDSLSELTRADNVLQTSVAIAARLPLAGLVQRMG